MTASPLDQRIVSRSVASKHKAVGQDLTTRAPSLEKPGETSARPVNLSLFLWGNDEAPGREKYRLMIEGAKYADRAGFEAVWTPERHFHAFGGPYPNPSVAAAALAAVTEHIGIRAGSCVAPLHHPIRIAEEWAVVDNLSNGRVALAFASGWQVNDFILRPENHARNHEVLWEQLDQVRRLWRGERVSFPNAEGRAVAIQTLPRPVQSELPVWVTAAGNPETFGKAGASGANVLTHLLGKSVEDVAGLIELYRQARAGAGHDPATGRVTLMLHTFAGNDDSRVREIVRGPMKRYLRSSLKLVISGNGLLPDLKRFVGAGKPRESDLRDLSPAEMDAMLEVAFERYFETGGLFGSPASCARTVERCRRAGVNEIACLVDFGVPTDRVLESLEDLVRAQAANPADRESSVPPSINRTNGTPFPDPAGRQRPLGALLGRLKEQGIQISAEGDQLRCQAPSGVLTADLRDELRRNKHDILSFLRVAGAISQQPRSIVPLQPTGERVPVFAVAGHNGDVFAYRELVRHLGTDQPFFGLQPPGLDGTEVPLTNVEELAARFAGQIVSLRGRQPCIVAGYCAGGSIAFELACQLSREGVPVRAVALFGCPFPSLYRPWSRLRLFVREQIRRCVRIPRKLARMTFAERRRYLQEVLIRPATRRHEPAPDAADPQLRAWRAQVEAATLAAVSRYRPAQFDGKVCLFVPGRDWLREYPDILKWKTVANRAEEYYGPADCTTNVMLREPFVKHFAGLFQHSGLGGQHFG